MLWALLPIRSNTSFSHLFHLDYPHASKELKILGLLGKQLVLFRPTEISLCQTSKGKGR